MAISGINSYNYSSYYTGVKRNTAKAGGMDSALRIWHQIINVVALF